MRRDGWGGFAPLPPQQGQLRRRRATTSVRGTDGEDESPLPEQRPVGEGEGVARVVDVRRFGRRAVEFDDLEIATSAQIVCRRVANVVTARRGSARKDESRTPADCSSRDSQPP